MKTLGPDEIAPLLDGHVDLRWRTESLQPLRLPVAELGFYDAFNRWVGSCATACRLRLRTASTRLGLRGAQRLLDQSVGGERRGAYDLYVDGVLHARAWAQGGATIDLEKGAFVGDEAFNLTFAGLPVGDKTLELWLPQAATVSIAALDLDDGAQAAPVADGRPRVIFHGSSITHCLEAEGASAGWPAVAAGLAGVDHQNLGWAGSCLLSGQAARIIRDARADAIVLKLGINVHPEGQLKERAFLDSAHAMISIIREKHAATPILVVSPIYSPGREDQGSGGGLPLTRMRQLLVDVVAARLAAGDANIGYLDGLSLFGAADADLLPDDLHPNTEGYRLMGERFHALALSGPKALVRPPAAP
ncbi:GDSL-type esterase/lipase family protein [Phenylobacterium sp. NIBR 498073]|uniref:GDSL-type esterase/lipase family protein n=1 Tax=Phenylobacterium sp. NIBR 498073 TaxID=3015177 RepID=UPI0022B4E443|nr:GDSL-type esterase/lipase family protein [Phenylobacterium sp. NIBR 498073]WGU39980.1 SGNH/GDSL hydrolase family protein [Phenylobacterium sp. NIBR 498073]